MASLFDSASLVMLPSGVKEDKLYSIKPTDGSGDFTFSRGSDIQATRVNASGLIEKAKVNLVQYSNDFSNAYWQKTDVVVSGTRVTDPFGGTTAWSCAFGSATNSRIERNDGAAGFIKTQSIWVRVPSGTQDFILGFSGGEYVTFTATTTWQRFETFTPSGSNFPRILCEDSATLEIYGFQVNYGLVAQDYVETTTTAVVEGLTADLPRLDYSGGASCPSLLLEPSRTNLLAHSDYVNDSQDVSNITITTNSTTSPEGVVNASKVVPNTSNTFHWFGESVTGASAVYTQTIYAKADTYDHLFMVLRTDGGAKRYGVKFNLSTGEFVDDITFGSPTQTDYDIQPFGTDGWYRCSVSSNHSTGTDVVALFGPSIGGNLTTINNEFPGDGTSGIYVFGAQLEAGSYPTSYIPTYGTAAVRGADSCSKTSASALIGQTEGTMFLEAEAQSGFRTFSICDGTTSNRITIAHNVPSSFTTIPVYGGVVGTQLSTSYTSGNVKIAVAYGGGSYSMFVNGVKINSTSIGAFSSTLNKIEFAQGNGGNPFAGDVKQSLLFPTALTDAECIALTTI